jgi:formate hydrogenlyase subunit 6/NADH:ubiquinone oxidoreductase subunit I
VDDFFGVSTVDERKCTGCRLCEDVCGWDAVHIFPLKDEMKKDISELTEHEIERMKMVKETVVGR